MSNGLDPDLGPNHWQRLSADYKHSYFICEKVRWNKESHPEINGPAYKISKLIASTSSHHSDKPSHMVRLARSFTSHILKYGGRERPKPKIILLA